MPAETIELFALCLNERRMLPYFFRHYGDLVDRFTMLDNGSTDGSLAMLAGDPRVTVTPFSTTGDSFVECARRLLNEAWKPSRGRAGWVVVVEVDEHLHHPDLRGYLSHLRDIGGTAVQALGYQMVADTFPSGPRPLHEQVVRGARDVTFDKLAAFRPDALVATNFGPGRHEAQPTGHVVLERDRQVRLLHYKFLGVDYVCERNRELAAGLRVGDRSANMGTHYTRSRDAVAHDAAWLSRRARRVPGLVPAHPLDLTMEDEQLVLWESGLFDAAYYRATNPDIASRDDVDPLEHFCRDGWREGRWPNRGFDTKWYVRTYARQIRPDVNPLLDYVLRGERAGCAPCVGFDASVYRHAEGLSYEASPLRHWLARKRERAGRIAA